MAKKLTVKELVDQNLEELKNKSHGQLFKWAREHGIDSGIRFTNFKKALLSHGIDYNALREEKRVEKVDNMLEKATHSLTFYSDAKAKNDRFAICGKDGEPLWYGKFFSNDNCFNGEQSSGEMAAAKKAVWLASKVKEALNLESIKLKLFVDAEWLVYANCVFNGSPEGRTARALGEEALQSSVFLEVKHIIDKILHIRNNHPVCIQVNYYHVIFILIYNGMALYSTTVKSANRTIQFGYVQQL